MGWVAWLLPHLAAESPHKAVWAGLAILVGVLLWLMSLLGGFLPLHWVHDPNAASKSALFRGLQRACQRLQKGFMLVALVGGPIWIWSSYDDPAQRELCAAFLVGFVGPIYLAAGNAKSACKVVADQLEEVARETPQSGPPS